MASKKYVKDFFKVIYLYSVHPLSAGGWVSYQIFKKGGLTGSQFLESLQFLHKNKLKFETLNNKKKL